MTALTKIEFAVQLIENTSTAIANRSVPWLDGQPGIIRLLFRILVLGPLTVIPAVGVCFGALSPLILLTWASVRYGERKHSDPIQCKHRLIGDDVIGSPDFYGMGIRLGIYLSWLASLLANAFVPSEHRAMAGAYAGFTLALLVAVILLIVQDGCAYTAEMIVLLNFLWGGTYLVCLPFFMVPQTHKQRPEDPVDRDANSGTESKKQKRLDGIKAAIYPVIMSIIPVTTWFWVRLATVGEVDFAPAPHATIFLFFYKVKLNKSRFACIYMASLCIWLVSTPVLAILLGCARKIPRMRRFVTFGALLTAHGLLSLAYWVFVRMFGNLIGWIRYRLAPRRGRHEQFMQWHAELELETIVVRWATASIGLIIMGWTVLCIELTLGWNDIHGVYDVSSTGQVIPLVVGLGTLIRVIWKLRAKGNDNISMEAIFIPIAFQRPDSTWQ